MNESEKREYGFHTNIIAIVKPSSSTFLNFLFNIVLLITDKRSKQAALVADV